MPDDAPNVVKKANVSTRVAQLLGLIPKTTATPASAISNVELSKDKHKFLSLVIGIIQKPMPPNYC